MRFALILGSLVTTAALGAAVLLLAQEADVEEEKVFIPPTAEQRRAAIGSLDDLSPALRRAFEPTDAFLPVSEPGPDDWLATFPERGQSFDAYVESRPNRPDAKRRRIYLQPIGRFASDSAPSVETIRSFAAAYFGLTVEIRPALTVDDLRPGGRVHPGTGKRQLRTGDILDALEKRLPDDAYCLLGVTMEDLYPDEQWNFVFGQARLRDRVGVYSFARYDPRFFGRKAPENVGELVLARSAKVLAHETGHMFGMHHCIYFDCLMCGSNHLAESDARPLTLCPVCLRKLHHAVGFDPAERYERLGARCREMGLAEEARWMAGRVAHIRKKGEGR